MIKKTGIFLLIMLMLWAVLLLMSTGGNSGSAVPTKPPQAQSGAVQDPNPQTTDPDGGEETIPVETTLQMVRRLLEAENLPKTARSHWIWEPDLNAQQDTRGTAKDSEIWALALIAAEQKMNPISAFQVLKRAGFYTQSGDDSGVFAASAFSVPSRMAVTYEHTDSGARQLVSDLLSLASGLKDGLAMESGLLGANSAVDEGQMSYDKKEDCYYGYFISGGERSTHILCFYLRSEDGEQITKVEFQLLNMRSATGDEKSLQILDNRGDNQAATLIAAAELLMTGQTQAGQGIIPFTRQVTSYMANIERFYFIGDGEAGTLTNYSLSKI